MRSEETFASCGRPAFIVLTFRASGPALWRARTRAYSFPPTAAAGRSCREFAHLVLIAINRVTRGLACQNVPVYRECQTACGDIAVRVRRGAFFLSWFWGRFGPCPSCVARFALICALQPRTFHPFAATLCCGVRRFNSVPGPTILDFCRTAPFLCTLETAGTVCGVKITHTVFRTIIGTVPRAPKPIDRSRPF